MEFWCRHVYIYINIYFFKENGVLLDFTRILKKVNLINWGLSSASVYVTCYSFAVYFLYLATV